MNPDDLPSAAQLREIYLKEITPVLRGNEQLHYKIQKEVREPHTGKALVLIFFMMCAAIAQEGADRIWAIASLIIFLACWIFCHKKENGLDKFDWPLVARTKAKVLPPLLQTVSNGQITWQGHPQALLHHFLVKINEEDYERRYNQWVKILYGPDITTLPPDPEPFISNQEIRRSGIFLDFDSRYTDDEFKGTYRDVPFKISETSFYHVTVESFKGVLITFKFNKHIKTPTVVYTRGRRNKRQQAWVYAGTAIILAAIILAQFVYMIPWIIWTPFLLITGIASIISFVLLTRPAKKEDQQQAVTLEDPIFNKRFAVYSADQLEARYLVTPAFMQRFSDLKTAFKANDAQCAFFDDTLFIALHTKQDIFEIRDCLPPLTKTDSIQKFWQELSSVFQMVDYFKLHEHIYLK